MKIKIMIVDDTFENRFFLKKILANKDFDVIELDNAQSAIDYIKFNSVDLIFTDINMNKLTGVEFIQKIRELEQLNTHHSPVEIVAMSSFINKELEDKLINLGANQIFKRPLDIKQLQNLLTKYSFAIESVEKNIVTVPLELKVFIPEYIELRKKEIIELEKNLKASNFDEIKSIAHKLLGHAESYGFNRLANLASFIDIAAEQRKEDLIIKYINSYKIFMNTLEIKYNEN